MLTFVWHSHKCLTHFLLFRTSRCIWSSWYSRWCWSQLQRRLHSGEAQPEFPDSHVPTRHGQVVGRIQSAVCGGTGEGSQPGSGYRTHRGLWTTEDLSADFDHCWVFCVSRSTRILPPPLQYRPLPLLLAQQHLLLRQSQWQILLALHHRSHSHDACGRWPNPTLHQQVPFSTDIIFSYLLRPVQWIRVTDELRFNQSKCLPTYLNQFKKWTTKTFTKPFHPEIWKMNFLLCSRLIQVFCLWGSISRCCRPQSGHQHSHLSTRMEEPLDRILLLDGRTEQIENRHF